MNNIFTLKEIIEREISILNDYENIVLNVKKNEIDFYNLIQKYINETDKINKNKLDYNKIC